MNIKSTLLLLLIMALLSCHQEARPTAKRSKKEMGKQIYDNALELDEQIEIEPPRSSKAPNPPEPEINKGSKIIKNGNMAFVVKNLSDSKTHVDSLLKNLDAYYENETYQASTYNSSYNLKIRIRADQFENLVSQLESGVGQLTVKNLRADDVTARYIDLTIKIDNNLAYLKRYNQLLQKAQSIEDMMEIQDKTRTLEQEINSLKGSLKYLNDKASYSSLNLNLTAEKERVIAAKTHFGTEIIASIKVGLDGFKFFILTVIRLWPFILLVSLIIGFRRRIKWPRIRTKK